MTRDSSKRGLGRRDFLKLSAITGVSAWALPMFANQAFASHTKGTLRAGLIGFSVVNTLDPGRAALNSDFWVITAMFNGLVRFNPDMTLAPELAESWHNESPTAIVFKLRQGVKFHNGEEMTSEDVKFSLDRVRSEAFGSPNRGKFIAIDSIDAIDKYTVRINTKQPSVPIMAYMANAVTGSQIVPKKVVEAVGDEEFGRNPVGTGPFKITEWRPNERITMVAHEDYFISDQPKVAACDLLLIAEETSGVNALLGGDIDVASSAPFADVPQLEQNPDVVIAKTPGLNWRFCGLNTFQPPFDDRNFRRAISMATDRDAIVKAVLFGEGRPMQGVTPLAIPWAYSNQVREVCQFNPERARAEMNKGKYGSGTEAVIVTWGAGWWKRWTEVFVATINQVLDINFTIEVTDANIAFQRWKGLDLEGTCTGWIGRVEVDEYMGDCFHSQGSRNFGKYSNPEVDRLIELGRAEFDQAKRGQYYIQAEDIVVEDCPVIFSVNNNAHAMWRKGVEGFVPTPFQALGSQLGPVSIP